MNTCGWIVGFTAIVYLLGFLIAIPLFTVVYLQAHKEKWYLSLSCGFGLWLCVYLAFVVVLKSRLYEGLIFRMIS